jgi:hypothetical protein
VAGKQLNLKGTLSFLCIKERHIARAALQMNAMDLQNHLIIIAEGSMTKKQIEIIQEKRNIHPEAIIAAIHKLKEIHVNWKDVDLIQLEQQIQSIKPHFIDVTSEVESGDANIEEKESYTCYFPNGTTDKSNGGYNEVTEFKES